jgi:hypothetical protein
VARLHHSAVWLDLWLNYWRLKWLCRGQTSPPEGQNGPEFKPSALLDFELEMVIHPDLLYVTALRGQMYSYHLCIECSSPITCQSNHLGIYSQHIPRMWYYRRWHIRGQAVCRVPCVGCRLKFFTMISRLVKEWIKVNAKGVICLALKDVGWSVLYAEMKWDFTAGCFCWTRKWAWDNCERGWCCWPHFWLCDNERLEW